MTIRRTIRIGAAVAAVLTATACTRTGEVLHPSDGAAPVVLQLTDVRLAAGFGHVCAVVSGTLRCWGDDSDGQLGVTGGDGGTGQAPVTVGGGPWIAPAAGSHHTCALANDGGVWCWGGNTNGQLGSGDCASRPEPRQVALPAKAVDVRTAFEFTCALLADASVWCWGYNQEGQLGLGDDYPGDDHLAPIQLGTDRDWTFIATGQGHGCGIRAPGRLYCWGRNTNRSSGRGSRRRKRSARRCRSAPTRTGFQSAARSRRPARASETAPSGAGASRRAARSPPATSTLA